MPRKKTKYNSFVAKMRKAGYTFEQIGRMWRSEKKKTAANGKSKRSK